jgi:hypothetical protein
MEVFAQASPSHQGLFILTTKITWHKRVLDSIFKIICEQMNYVGAVKHYPKALLKGF